MEHRQNRVTPLLKKQQSYAYSVHQKICDINRDGHFLGQILCDTIVDGAAVLQRRYSSPTSSHRRPPSEYGSPSVNQILIHSKHHATFICKKECIPSSTFASPRPHLRRRTGANFLSRHQQNWQVLSRASHPSRGAGNAPLWNIQSDGRGWLCYFLMERESQFSS